MTWYQVEQATIVRAVSSAKLILVVVHSPGYRSLVRFLGCAISSHREVEVEIHPFRISVRTTEQHQPSDIAGGFLIAAN